MVRIHYCNSNETSRTFYAIPWTCCAISYQDSIKPARYDASSRAFVAGLGVNRVEGFGCQRKDVSCFVIEFELMVDEDFLNRKDKLEGFSFDLSTSEEGVLMKHNKSSKSIEEIRGTVIPNYDVHGGCQRWVSWHFKMSCGC